MIKREKFGIPQNTDPIKDAKIVEALLGADVAKKYEAAFGTKSSTDTSYEPTQDEVEKVRQERNKAKEAEKNIAESKRLMLAWANESGIEDEYIEKHVEYLPNGDIIWNGFCDFSNNKKVTSFPPRLKEVNGALKISGTNIESLSDCPLSVTQLYCSDTNIKSLKGCPVSVKSIFCSHTGIKNLVGCPSSVNNIICSNTPISSLEGCPLSVTFVEIIDCYDLLEVPEGLNMGLYFRVNSSQTELILNILDKGYDYDLDNFDDQDHEDY